MRSDQNFSGFITKQQETVYLKLTEKLLQYVSYKLISVMKLAEESGFNCITGEFSAPDKKSD